MLSQHTLHAVKKYDKPIYTDIKKLWQRHDIPYELTDMIFEYSGYIIFCDDGWAFGYKKYEHNNTWPDKFDRLLHNHTIQIDTPYKDTYPIFSYLGHPIYCYHAQACSNICIRCALHNNKREFSTYIHMEGWGKETIHIFEQGVMFDKN